MFSTLLNGAALYPLNIKHEGLTGLAGWLNQEEITIYRSITSVFSAFTDTLTGTETFPKLRLVRLGAEPVSRRDAERFKRHFSAACLFANQLSCIEANTFRIYFIDHQTAISGNIVPVGYAVEDTEVLLFDDDGKDVGATGVGEIVVRSRYLSPGYWRRPDLTQAVFLPDPQGGDRRLYRTGDLGRSIAGWLPRTPRPHRFSRQGSWAHHRSGGGGTGLTGPRSDQGRGRDGSAAPIG